MKTGNIRILLVEDDEELSSLISEYLTDNGLEVFVVSHGEEVDSATRKLQPDLIILDLMLPGKDGLQLCRELKAWFTGPIMMLTARTGWVDELVGLELGADEYLGKPTEPRLLLARIRLLLRRAAPTPTLSPPAQASLDLDRRSRSASLNGQPLELTDAEFDLLAYLREHAGEELTRSQLSEDVFSQAYDGLGRSIDVRVGRLRAKLGEDAKHPRWIKSIRGVGYLFVEPS